MPDIDERLAAAHRDARDADNIVASLSRERLKELKNSPAREAARLAVDPTLTAGDRAELERHLQKFMPRTLPKPQRRQWPLTLPRAAVKRWLPPLLIVTIVVALSWWNTPRQHAGGVVVADLVVEWHHGERLVARQPFVQGSQLPVVGSDDGQWIVRGWVPAFGRVTARLPRGAISLRQP